jgi:uncharacterized UPF0146 family protein
MPGTDSEILNPLGDRLLSTTGRHGGNVSSQRVDELDLLSLEFAKKQVKAGGTSLVIDIGGGDAAQSKRFAELGADVLLVDLTDQSENIASFNRKMGKLAIRFYQADATKFEFEKDIRNVNVLYSQRMLGCIKYNEALELLQSLFEITVPTGRCFLSTGGLNTEVGLDYPHRDLPVSQRWAPPGRAMGEKHEMFAPQCLYLESEFVDLVRSIGFVVLKSWTSLFGNPKLVARKGEM